MAFTFCTSTLWGGNESNIHGVHPHPISYSVYVNIFMLWSILYYFNELADTDLFMAFLSCIFFSCSESGLLRRVMAEHVLHHNNVKQMQSDARFLPAQDFAPRTA